MYQGVPIPLQSLGIWRSSMVKVSDLFTRAMSRSSSQRSGESGQQSPPESLPPPTPPPVLEENYVTGEWGVKVPTFVPVERVSVLRDCCTLHRTTDVAVRY